MVETIRKTFDLDFCEATAPYNPETDEYGRWTLMTKGEHCAISFQYEFVGDGKPARIYQDKTKTKYPNTPWVFTVEIPVTIPNGIDPVVEVHCHRDDYDHSTSLYFDIIDLHTDLLLGYGHYCCRDEIGVEDKDGPLYRVTFETAGDEADDELETEEVSDLQEAITEAATSPEMTEALSGDEYSHSVCSEEDANTGVQLFDAGSLKILRTFYIPANKTLVYNVYNKEGERLDYNVKEHFLFGKLYVDIACDEGLIARIPLK